jgi:hypothetical protein
VKGILRNTGVMPAHVQGIHEGVLVPSSGSTLTPHTADRSATEQINGDCLFLLVQ